MRFSARVPAARELNRLAALLATGRAAGRAIVDLTESNPTRAGLVYPADLLAPLADPRGLHYRPEPLGLMAARQAIAADFARRQHSVDPGRIAITASTSEAYSLLFKILCDPGDEVLVPRPSYPLFEHLTQLEGITAVPYHLEYHGSWSIDVASAETGLSGRTRAILLVTPNNPTGNFVSHDEVERLAGVCAARNIAIIADEVFADYPLDDRVPHTGPLLSRTDVLGFTLGGLSKTIGLPQAKLGWIVVSGGEAEVQETLARLEFACDTYLSVSTAVQAAAAELLGRGGVVRDQIRERIGGNGRWLHAQVAGTPACNVLHSDAGWYAVLQVPSLVPEEDLVLELLQEDAVLVHPGYFFDFPSECFLVVSLLARPESFHEGIIRILRHFDCNSARP